MRQCQHICVNSVKSTLDLWSPEPICVALSNRICDNFLEQQQKSNTLQYP